MAEAEACKRRAEEAEAKEERLLRETAEKVDAEKQRRVSKCVRARVDRYYAFGVKRNTIVLKKNTDPTNTTTNPP